MALNRNGKVGFTLNRTSVELKLEVDTDEAAGKDPLIEPVWN